MKRTILIALMALLAIGASAKKTKVAKASAPSVTEIPATAVDTFSYLSGKANTNGLLPYLAQRMGVDTTYIAYFIAGFDQGELTEADKQEKARLAGVEIRTQVENQILQQLTAQLGEENVSHDLFIAGFRTGVCGEGDLLPMPADSLHATVQAQTERLRQEMIETKYGPNRTAGEEFLRENATKDSVMVTESGLQYKILVQGDGKTPKKTQKVKVHYRGTLLDGTEFDSSYKRSQPSTFACNQVIKGWTEALTMMPVGSKWIIWVPQELAYGDKESGKVPPYSMLTFEVELIDIVK